MKHFSCLLLFSLLLASCASAGTNIPAAETVTNTAAPPTATPTITHTPTITPTVTPVEKPFDFQVFLDTERERFVKEYGYASWDELTQKEVTDKIDFSKEKRMGLKIQGVPYGSIVEKGLVLDIATIPVTTDYWINKEVKSAVVMEMAFPNSSIAMVLVGFEMQDGKYEATLPVEVGPSQSDWSQDVRLKTKASLQHLIGGLYSVKAVGVMRSGTEVSLGSALWNDMAEGHPTTIRHFEILSSRGRNLFEAAIINPAGYANRDTGLLKVLIEKPPDLPNSGQGNFFKLYAWYMDWANEQDAWLIGEVLGPDGTGNGVIGR